MFDLHIDNFFAEFLGDYRDTRQFKMVNGKTPGWKYFLF